MGASAVGGSSLPEVADRLVRTAVANATREFPYAAVTVFAGPADLQLPRERHPAFYGCYDWHSAVHTHWLLVRLLRLHPDRVDAAAARTVLETHLTVERISQEAAVLRSWPGFERPYGWAWLLALAAEATDWAATTDDPSVRGWADALRPAAEAVDTLLLDWLPRAGRPVRDGTHANTAFALGLVLDAAPLLGLTELEGAVRGYVGAQLLADVDAPLAWEPSGHDFLSPGLSEADLVRRVLPAEVFAAWLTGFWPRLATGAPSSVLEPVVPGDRSDGQAGHLDGLNLSRAANLDALAGALGEQDERVPVLRRAAEAHRTAGLAALTETGYLSTHWLGTFAVLALTAAP
ncbi:MAG: hypothetical protein JWP61_358 [Friedmanniella sp.]|nr:hypothetical protein [Friedmanniella sp.]